MVRQGRPARVRIPARAAALRLRKALGPGVLEGRSELHLILPDDAWIDWEVAPERLREARSAAARRRPGTPPREAVEIADRGLLPGLEAPWIDARRGELADLRVEALEALAAAGTRLGGAVLPEAEQAARAAVAAQPFRESARGALMEVLQARGNVNEALRVYEDIRVLLREELGSSPGAALVALHEQLLRADRAPDRAADRASAPLGLVERDREIALLDNVLHEAVAGEGRAVLIEGPPGIGKSRLLAEFRRRAGAEGALVLNARAGELEREFPFGVVRQLFEGVVSDPDDARRRRRPRRRRLQQRPTTGGAHAATRRSPPCTACTGSRSTSPPSARCCSRSTTCTGATARRLRFLAYLVRRLEGQPVLVSASVRTGDPPTDAALLAEIANDPATAHVRPGPLSEEAVGDARRRSASAPSPTTPSARPATRTTGGNPLLVRQLLNALETDGVTPDAAHADVVRAIGSRAVSSTRPAAARPAPGRGRRRRPRGRGARRERRAARRRRRSPGSTRRRSRARWPRSPAPRSCAPSRRSGSCTRSSATRSTRGLPPGERELLHARAAAVLREAGARARAGRRPADAHARGAATPRSSRLLHEAGDRGRWRAARSTAPSATCGARSTSRRARRGPPAACCSTSARSRRSPVGPTPRCTCARPTTG